MALLQYNEQFASPSGGVAGVLTDALGNETTLGMPFSVSYTFTRPADTTAYAAGDLVANSTTAGSVVPMSWVVGKGTGRPVSIRRVRVFQSNPTVTGGTYKVFLFSAAPTVATAGDNGAFATDVSSVGAIGESGVVTVIGYSDGAMSAAAPIAGTEITLVPTAATVYGLLMTTGTPTPTSAETFTVTLEGWQY
jgi:hypothetical protein